MSIDPPCAESTFPIIELQETPNHPICIEPPSYILPQRLALLSCSCIPWSSKNTKNNTEKMSSTHVDDATHGTILSDSLRRLQLKEQIPSSLVEPSRRKDGEGNAEDQGDVLVLNSGPPSPGTLQRQALGHVYEGYGFRLTSGPATPTNPPPVGTSSPLPDPNGLGWPGKPSLCFYFFLPLILTIHDSKVDTRTFECFPRRASRSRGETSRCSSNLAGMHW